MTRKYKIEELAFNHRSEKEEIRTRIIFDELKNRATNNKKLSEYEMEFFCMCLQASNLNDGNISDFKCCDSYRFKTTYLNYFFDITGGSKYFKPYKNEIRQISIGEVRNELDYLIHLAKQWGTVITKTNHREYLLNQISKEARTELKNLDKQPEFANDPYAKGKFNYLYKKWSILIRSKYLYHICLEIYDANDDQPYRLLIEKNEIEINEYSLIHILSRHFSEVTKQYDSSKSFHSEDFKPRLLGNKLQEIFDHIKSSGITIKDLRKIPFKNGDTIYFIWSEIRQKTVKGKGNVDFRRMETFYPLTKESEIEKLNENYDEIIIDKATSIYIEKEY